ncbi:MAG TPA: FAD:protein FMN transferase, partial [Microbacterium sp.]|nr:FAD:protein FMN transferase [Microbacterium sp.]
PAHGVVSASVIDDSLTRADLWATAAVVAGFEDRSWVARSGTRTGIVVADDGRVTRWLHGTSVDVVAADSTLV